MSTIRRLSVRRVSIRSIEHSTSARRIETKGVDVDALTPVSKAYEHKLSFWFTGSIEKVCFDFGDGTDLSTEEKIDLKLVMD